MRKAEVYIDFLDIMLIHNVHAFVIWEYVHKHKLPYRKDKWGRGSIRWDVANKHLTAIGEYSTKFLICSYNDPINRKLYTKLKETKYVYDVEYTGNVKVYYYVNSEGEIFKCKIYKNLTTRLERYRVVEKCFEIIKDLTIESF